jgi:8-oxo-dGTP diphosphatase
VSDQVELSVSAIVFDRDDRLLLVKRSNEPGRARWALPGGRVKRGETLREAVVRETSEETSIAVLSEAMVGLVEWIDDDHHFVIVAFESTTLDADQPKPGGDAAAARWVPRWQVSDLPLVDGLLDFLAEHDYVSVIS